MTDFRSSYWRRSLLEATLTSAFVLGLFYYWYGLADRYVVFLYGHTTTGISNAQPFDEVTSGRYWMCGLVAAGAVMTLYTAANWLQGWIARQRGRNFVPPAWWYVWLLSIIPTGIGILAITMNVNSPTLPLVWAMACVVATWTGLAVALMPGQWAAERPWDLIWLAADGLGLMSVLLLLRAVELPSRGLSISSLAAWLLAIGSLLGGLVWLAGMSILRLWRHKDRPSAGAIFLAGLGLSYVLMPLMHYLLAPPPTYRYITTASNFFAFNPSIQLLVVIMAGGMAFATAYGRDRLMHKERTAVMRRASSED